LDIPNTIGGRCTEKDREDRKEERVYNLIDHDDGMFA
jgi:hypothetical protein